MTPPDRGDEAPTEPRAAPTEVDRPGPPTPVDGRLPDDLLAAGAGAGAPSRRPAGRLAVALAAAVGLLLGVIAATVAAVFAAEEPRTVTREATVTVERAAPPPATTGGPVVVQTQVPPLVGERLDVALERLERAGFGADVSGGVLPEVAPQLWTVVEQDPAPGTLLDQGATVRVVVGAG